jgi:hypothetical protein
MGKNRGPAGLYPPRGHPNACTSQGITVQQVKSKYDSLKLDWKAWKAFIDHTGLGWYSEKGVPTGPPEVLEAFFESIPRARKFRDKPLHCASKLQTLLDGAIASGDYCTTIDNIIQLDSELEETQLQIEPHDDNNDNQSEATEEYSWPNNSPPSLATPGLTLDTTSNATSTPNAASTPNPAPRAAATSQDRSGQSLGPRKRKSKNAAEADLRKRKKGSSGHALTDAVQKTAAEWTNTNTLYANQMKQRDSIAERQFVGSRVVDVLVAEFSDLSVPEEDFIGDLLENNKTAALLFLARTPERRRIWVEQQLAKRHED